MVCRSLFFFWPLHCLFFFELRHLITIFVSSNFSYNTCDICIIRNTKLCIIWHMLPCNISISTVVVFAAILYSIFYTLIESSVFHVSACNVLKRRPWSKQPILAIVFRPFLSYLGHFYRI